MARDNIDELQTDWSEQRPELDADAMGVVLRIQALAKILGDRAAGRLLQHGLQWWQYDVLSALRRQGHPYRLTASALADAGRLTSGAMTNRIDRLETRGLVRRRPDRNDRRGVNVSLTAKGRKLIDKAIRLRLESARRSLKALDAEQQHELANLLRIAVLAAPEPD